MKTTTIKSESAADAYAAEYAKAIMLLDEIREVLNDMPAPENREYNAAAINWCNVGDIQEINHQLRSIITFVCGK